LRRALCPGYLIAQNPGDQGAEPRTGPEERIPDETRAALLRGAARFWTLVR
jgi:hypothetical protein